MEVQLVFRQLICATSLSAFRWLTSVRQQCLLHWQSALRSVPPASSEGIIGSQNLSMLRHNSKKNLVNLPRSFLNIRLHKREKMSVLPNVILCSHLSKKSCGLYAGSQGQPNCIPHSMFSLCQSKPNMFYAWLVMANLSQIDMSITTQCYTLRTKRTMSSCFSLVAIYYKIFLYVNSKDRHCLTMSYVDDEKTIDDSMTPISATGSFTTQTLKKNYFGSSI